ncbi:NAD(P)-dependent oxidoreductase [Streptomyces sp. V4I2]|uniref:NAD(P)-dependent oxidoreductase n=1 Tax=Streptomyces sp. V4I2 TaxID=3042280 RepID=UPI00277FAA80|nr:NAD(P)-dependent oxidoreductase [Streptomyces sp. V4I2]MDQ1051958.1 3-hydroxyisobutyrate dehydrogenase-like beta-hydroxyacid dehydrogenase [Streptomyces sp. V4I2]
MDQQIVGILHPGSMGAAMASALRPNAQRVLWCPEGRSRATIARAELYGLEPVPTLGDLVEQCHTIISLCPPAAAEDVARQVAAHGGFRGGLYVEANAISPATVDRICELLPDVWAIVDAAVVGSPPTGGKKPRLYLSGWPNPVRWVEELFAGTDVSTHNVGSNAGQASALKLSYTSFQKTSRVLAALALAAAREHGVDQELIDIASKRGGSYLAEPEYVAKTAARAWRWGPELEEAADMLAAAGLPPEMMRAAAATLARWDDVKDGELTLTDALNQLAQP